MGMETSIEPLVVSSFRGLNTRLSPISISPREATSLQNVNPTRETIDVRPGSTLFTTTQLIEGGVVKPVTGVFQAVLGNTVHRVMTGGSKIYSVTSGGVVADITGAVTITDDPNNLFQFAKAKDSGGNDIIVACNGVDAPIKWTGAGNAAALGGTPPGNFKHILWRGNRLWGTDGEFTYHSALLNAESWDPLFWVLKVSSSGIYTNEMTGIVEYGPNIALFKEDRIVLFAGENFTNGEAITVVSGDGNMSGYSLVEVSSRLHGNIIIFVNRSNEFKGFNATKNLIDISYPIDDALRTYVQSRAKYISAVNYGEYSQYYATVTQAGSTHNRIIIYDYFLDGFNAQPDVPESTMFTHTNIEANCLAIMDSSGKETLYSGTYDGWLLQHGGYDFDVVKAAQIDPAGAVRAANVVTITTLAPHGFEVGDEVIVLGVTPASFDGTFTITTVPNTDEFTYDQVDADDAGGDGIARIEAYIDAHWQSKKNSLGNAAIQKQINDFNIVTVANTSGQLKTTVYTESGNGVAINDIDSGEYYYGDDSFYGEAYYGGGGTTYNRAEFSLMDGVEILAGRYLTVRFENIDGFRFSIEEYIMGVSSLGYQAEMIV